MHGVHILPQRTGSGVCQSPSDSCCSYRLNSQHRLQLQQRYGHISGGCNSTPVVAAERHLSWQLLSHLTCSFLAEGRFCTSCHLLPTVYHKLTSCCYLCFRCLVDFCSCGVSDCSFRIHVLQECFPFNGENKQGFFVVCFWSQ